MEDIIDNSVEQNTVEQTPIAKIAGKALVELPEDLYIPPQALEVFLEAFEGPLDLLLYLIKKQNIDILNIPIAEITRQYMEYVELMRQIQLNLAGEYLVMAAILAEIKSRMLLPRPESADDEEEDPRAELIRRLQEYERFKIAAEGIDNLPRQGRETHQVKVSEPVIDVEKPKPQVDMKEIMLAFIEVMRRADQIAHHHVASEPLSVRERMLIIIDKINSNEFVAFTSLFTVEEGRKGVVVTLIAILELIKESVIDLVQAKPFGEIHVRAVSDE